MIRRAAAHLRSLALTAALVPLAVHAQGMVAVPGDPLDTATGKVAGTQLPSGVRAYLGIPYAKPPVGDLRWAPPQPTRWSGVWNADRKTPECIQVLRRHDINHYFGEEPSGEDCLYLNVWAPAGAAPGAKLPVIVFIYGGGGTIGSAGMAHYDGEAVAKAGAIFVNMNYRVGILGLMAHPELSAQQGGHSGNYTYMDQNLALRWVHDNIAAFGGDPAQVVLAGQSFGSSAVAEQVMSPQSKGLFRGAVFSSGCNFTREGAPLAEGEKMGLEIQKRLGVRDLAGMRNAPADRILALQAETQNMTVNAGVTVPRIIDGAFVVAPKAQVLSQHLGSAVPVIAGSNGDDNDMQPDRYPLSFARTVAEYNDLARQMYGADADAFLKLYPVKTDADVWAMSRRAANEASASGYMAGARDCALLQTKYNAQPTYVDMFERRHAYIPGVTIADQNTATVGAYHNADIPFWFGTIDAFNKVRPTRAWTDADRALSTTMMQSLIAFAKTGNPQTAAVKWPAWTPAAPQYAVFDQGVSLRSMDTKRMDWMAAHKPAPVTLPKRDELRAHD